MKILICFLYVIVHVFQIADCKPPGHHGHHPNSPDVLYATVKPRTPKPEEPTYENVAYGNHGNHHHHHHHHKPGENEVVYGNSGDYHEPTYAELKFPSPGDDPIYENVGFRGPCHHHKHKHPDPNSIYAEVKGPAPPGHRGPNDDNSIYGSGGSHHRGHHHSNDDEEIFGYVGHHPHHHNGAHSRFLSPPLPRRPPNNFHPILGSCGGKHKTPKTAGCFGRR